MPIKLTAMATILSRCIFLVLLAAVLGGCSRSRVSNDYDSDAARQILISTLDAWENGQAAELGRRQPPIRFEDDDFMAGWRLVAYEIKHPEIEIRPFETVFVEIHLRNRKGKVLQRTAGYQVTLQPQFGVLRSES